MMKKYPTIYLTYRHEIHQKTALQAAPDELEIFLVANPTKKEILDLIPEMEFLITERSGNIDDEIISSGKKLNLIQRLGSQTYDIDVHSAQKLGIPVCYFPLPTSINVAEHIIMQILSLAKRNREMMKICQDAEDWGKESEKSDANTFSINWSFRENIKNVQDSIVGIVGFGDIGTELAKRLKNFNCTILYNKRNRIPEFAEKELGIHYSELEDLLNRSDYVCTLLPFTNETENFINSSFISKMKFGSCLVHSGASGALNEEDAAAALNSGHLYGLAVDGYAWEPIKKDNPLVKLSQDLFCNIVLTPHTAVGSIDMSYKRRIPEYQNIINFINGMPLRYQIN